MSDLAMLAARVTEFWTCVDRSNGPEACWPWMGYEEDGYGKYYWAGRMVGSHELAVTFTTGETRAKDLDTCHSCNNPICCNPSHLRFDTRVSNVADMLAARRDRPGRLTDEQVTVMRTRYTNGARQADLASRYGVTTSMVSQIVRGARYARAGGPISQARERYNHGE